MVRDHLSDTFSALADPTRRAILARLARSDASVSELAEPFDMSVRAISKHVAVLERAGLVSRGREAQRRPSRLQIAPILEVDSWLKHHLQLWERRLDRIADLLNKVQSEGGLK